MSNSDKMEIKVEIVFKGSRGSGKSTVLDVVKRSLQDCGYYVSDPFEEVGTENVYVTNDRKNLMLIPRDSF